MLATRLRSSRRDLVCVSLFAFILCCQYAAFAEETPKTSRPYRDGPLTKSDFAGQRPSTATTSAWSEFDYKWKYDKRYEIKNGVHIVRVTELDIWAEFRRDKSWNRRPEDPVLLDHEQGHFDIAQMMAIKALLTLTPHDPKNAPIVARHAKLETAKVNLETALTTAMQTFVKEAKELHLDYDKETNSGAHVRPQALARKAQREQLQTLVDELQRLPKK